MVKMSLGNSTSQGSSTSSISSSRISAYNSAISSLNSFISASNLQGSAYSSAKSYASTVLIPLIQGAILLSEAVSNAVTTFPSRYTSEVAGESLDSEVLEAQIATYQAAYDRSSAWLTSEMSKKVLNESSILRAQQSMARNLGKVTELQEKLDKLMAFNASSPSLFDEISGLYSAVSQGLSQVNNSFSSYNGTFSLPSKGELAWTTTITTAWDSYSTVNSYQNVLAKVNNGEDLTDADVQAVYAYAQLYPNEPLNQKLLDSLKGFVEKLKDSYEENSTSYDLYATVVEQLGIGVQRIGGLVSIFEGIRGPSTVDTNGVSTAFVIVNQSGVGQTLINNGSKLASWGKWGGRALTGIGFGLGMYDDMANKDKTVGQAVVHNGLSTGIGWGAAEVTTVIFGAFLGSTPVGWAAVGIAAVSFAAGAGASWLFNKAYDNNFLGLQDGLDAAGEWLDDAEKTVGQAVSHGVESAKSWATDVTNDIGNAISGGLSVLNPFD